MLDIPDFLLCGRTLYKILLQIDNIGGRKELRSK